MPLTSTERKLAENLAGQPKEEPVRVATYTRISTDESHQPYSLSAQAERPAGLGW